MISLDVMHSKPGIYLVTGRWELFFVETDAAGACHQLRPDTFERDGELPPGRWNPRGVTGIYGPLARPHKPTSGQIENAVSEQEPRDRPGFRQGVEWALSFGVA